MRVNIAIGQTLHPGGCHPKTSAIPPARFSSTYFFDKMAKESTSSRSILDLKSKS
jgi:hypothetical protein